MDERKTHRRPTVAELVLLAAFFAVAFASYVWVVAVGPS